MDIIISQRLRELRKQKNATQEDLANFLEISPQAVSKWERYEGLPDITLLPKIAAYYNVTVDCLLGIDEMRKEEKVNEYFRDSRAFLNQGKIAEGISLWREAVKEFPNDHRVIYELAFSIYFDQNGGKERYKEVIKLCKRVLEESTVQSLRDNATELICYSFCALGDMEMANEYAEKGSSINCSKEILKANISEGEDKTKANQELIIILLSLICNAVYKVESADWLTRHKAVIALSEAIFGDAFMGPHAGNVANAHYFLARIYAGCENANDKVKYHLEQLAKCIRQLDSVIGEYTYGGEILKGYTVSAATVIRNSEETIKEHYTRLIETDCPMFDKYRETEWFKAVIEGLGENK